MSLETRRESGDPDWTLELPIDDRDPARLGTELAAAVQAIADSGGGVSHLWIHDIDTALDARARAAGFDAHRDLWQLRCRLPTEPSTIQTRSLTPEDIDAFIAVNNRAFSWHPEQSGLTRERVETTMAEPWFDPEGFRIHESDGEIIGFCWTKVHGDEDPVLGEIYVIAIDPSAHGQGLGRPMTAAGLDHLSGQGIETAILYVEADNTAANRTYERIGFVNHRTDRAYHRTIGASIT